MHRWQPILSALLGRFDCDLLPFRLLLFRFLFIKIDNRAFGNQRRDFRRTDLHRLLHDQVHVFSLWNCLRERDPTAERRRFGFVQFPQTNFTSCYVDNFGGDFATAAVKDNKTRSTFHPQHIASVMSFGTAQAQRARVPMFW